MSKKLSPDEINEIQSLIDEDNAHIQLIRATGTPTQAVSVKRRGDLTPQYLSRFYGVSMGQITKKIRGV